MVGPFVPQASSSTYMAYTLGTVFNLIMVCKQNGAQHTFDDCDKLANYNAINNVDNNRHNYSNNVYYYIDRHHKLHHHQHYVHNIHNNEHGGMHGAELPVRTIRSRR